MMNAKGQESEGTVFDAREGERESTRTDTTACINAIT